MNSFLKRGLRLILKTTFCRFLLINTLKAERSRKMLNELYNSLGYQGKSNFHFLFSKIFRDNNVKFDRLILWKVKFNDRVINLPLADLWLDWDQALSILGHDITIKETYEDLIKNNKIKCVFDIGANYGTHSLLFLSQGIKTRTFEPNPNCTKIFATLLEANNLIGTVIAGAVGESVYETNLYFPEKNTWLGTLSQKVKTELEGGFDLMKVKTKVISLDSYLIGKKIIPDLIKIDTEGFELHVLKGAVNTIKEFKPMIIFEENEGGDQRVKITQLLESMDYNIYKLPYLAGQKNAISKIEFLKSAETNFIAVSVIPFDLQGIANRNHKSAALTWMSTPVNGEKCLPT